VDEVAAEHFAADFIVHYGRTCLSPYVQYIKGAIFYVNEVNHFYSVDPELEGCPCIMYLARTR